MTVLLHAGAAFDVYPSADSHEQEARLVSAGEWIEAPGPSDMQRSMSASATHGTFSELMEQHVILIDSFARQQGQAKPLGAQMHAFKNWACKT